MAASPIFSLAPGAGMAIASVADLDRYLAATADAGFDAVALSIDQLVDGPAATAKAVSDHGLRTTTLLSLRVTRDDEQSLAAAESLRPAVESLGATSVLTLVWTRLGDALVDRLGRISDRLGVPLALEFAPGPMGTLDDALSLAIALGASRATVLADTFHFCRGDSDWSMIDSAELDCLGIVQFSDALPAESDDYMHETVDRRTWPGEGELDLTRFTQALRSRGWLGEISVEILSSDLRRLPIEDFARMAYSTTARYWA